MEEINMEDMFKGLKIQFINNSCFFEGTILKVYENFFAVSVPIEQDNYFAVKLYDNIEYIVAYKDRAFKCRSQILGCSLSDRVSLFMIDKPLTLNSIERRRYPRVKVVMDVEYYFINDNQEYRKIEEVPKAYFTKLKKSFSVDLSANGIKIITYEDRTIPKYALVLISIENEKIYILCSIVRSDYDSTNKNYSTAMHFEDLDENKWQLINKFVYSKLSDENEK